MKVKSTSSCPRSALSVLGPDHSPSPLGKEVSWKDGRGEELVDVESYAFVDTETFRTVLVSWLAGEREKETVRLVIPTDDVASLPPVIGS